MGANIRCRVLTPCPYDVVIGRDSLEQIGALIAQVIAPCKVVIVSDDTVASLYAQRVIRLLTAAGYIPKMYKLPAGESYKNFESLVGILEFAASEKLTRTDLFIALGGGVIGDITGFAAAVYLRGVPFVQIPTTFLAAIDSSVGGKTAVNLTFGKNLAGVIKQPRLVVCDPSTFDTLDDDIFSDGTAEAIKYGMLADPSLFELFCQNNRTELFSHMEKIIEKCVNIKSGIVAADEFDTGERQLLNLGHTIGHAIEKCSNYTITHGRAIAIGMAIITRAAEKRGIAKDCVAPLATALNKHSLCQTCEYTKEQLFSAAMSDKKRSGDMITLVMPRKIGKCELYKLGIKQLLDIINEGMEGLA